MPKVSVIVPSRNERFLPETVHDLLTQARGDTEVIAMLEGYWPNPKLPDHPKLHIVHSGTPLGMRGAINAGCSLSRAEFVMKIDAHCRVGEGYDEILTKDLPDEVVMVPRRYGIEPKDWSVKTDGRFPIDRHYLSYPFQKDADGKPIVDAGLHGNPWSQRAKDDPSPIGDEMSSQGSCWIMRRKQWKRVGDLDEKNYGQFIQEFQEVGLKTQLRGNGRVQVNRNTWYAHLHKGPDYEGADGRKGRGYFLDRRDIGRGAKFCTDFWMHDRWSKQTRTMRWLIEQFWPVPTWPTDGRGGLDWDQVERDKAEWRERIARG